MCARGHVSSSGVVGEFMCGGLVDGCMCICIEKMCIDARRRDGVEEKGMKVICW